MALDAWPTYDTDAFARWRDDHLGQPLKVDRRATITVVRVAVVVSFALFAVGLLVARGLEPVALMIAGFDGLMTLVLWQLFKRADRHSLRRLDREGAVRGDGRRLPWRGFRGLEVQTARGRGGGEALWRIALHFDSGEAWLLPSEAANFAEVFALLQRMPVPVLQVRA